MAVILHFTMALYMFKEGDVIQDNYGNLFLLKKIGVKILSRRVVICDCVEYNGTFVSDLKFDLPFSSTDVKVDKINVFEKYGFGSQMTLF